MSNKKVNVLIYSGPGANASSVRHAIWSLRRLLGSNYAVLTVTGDQILKEPWTSSCALLVMPGGADLGYCRTLNGEGNRRIKQYVTMGGRYLGLCAGGYYGSGSCEFEVGKKGGMEVIGDRELGFFPGPCRGLAFPGFVYHSEAGTRAVGLKIYEKGFARGDGEVPETFVAYYNGGGVFVDAAKYKGRGVEVLASYTDELAVESGEGAPAAVVYCKVGEGAATLTGPHPEFSGVNLNPSEPTGHPDYKSVVDALVQDEQQRIRFMKACLTKFALEVSRESDDNVEVPSLSPLHLFAERAEDVAEMVHAWHEAGIIKEKEGGGEMIEGENDVFVLKSAEAWSIKEMATVVADSASSERRSQAEFASSDRLPDYNALPKTLVAHEASLPDIKSTPHFDTHAFFAHLKHYQSQHAHSDQSTFGKMLLYGQVVTSTSTMLEKNPAWLSHLPDGFTATATTQVAGRGRGSNVWVSPPGSLMFSTVLRHSLALSSTAPVVFVQYLAALAVVAGIEQYGGTSTAAGYDNIPVRLKWPNDIYALDPTAAVTGDEEEKRKTYVKIGGILVNSSYSGSGDYTLVVGIGLNVSNAAPTTSLSRLAQKLRLPPFTLEQLLASILTQFESVYSRFCRTGFDAYFQDLYYGRWLHSEQIVTLETEGGARARIKGITTDWGLLVAEELARETDRPTGRKWQLQSDSNSFDFFKGLLKRKM